MQIQELSTSERIILAEKLWDSVIEENSEIELSLQQTAELERRLQAFTQDQEFGSSWCELKERIIKK